MKLRLHITSGKPRYYRTTWHEKNDTLTTEIPFHIGETKIRVILFEGESHCYIAFGNKEGGPVEYVPIEEAGEVMTRYIQAAVARYIRQRQSTIISIPEKVRSKW